MNVPVQCMQFDVNWTSLGVLQKVDWSMQCARLSPHIEVLVSYLSFSYNYALTKWYAEVASLSALDVMLD